MEGPLIHHAGALGDPSEATQPPVIEGVAGHPLTDSFPASEKPRREIRRDLTERILAHAENRFRALMDATQADLEEGESWVRPTFTPRRRDRRT